MKSTHTQLPLTARVIRLAMEIRRCNDESRFVRIDDTEIEAETGWARRTTYTAWAEMIEAGNILDRHARHAGTRIIEINEAHPIWEAADALLSIEGGIF